MNRKKELKEWKTLVRKHKRQRFARKLYYWFGWRFEHLGWRESNYPICIPMKPIGKEREISPVFWSGYYTPAEFVDRILPALK